ncbi:MAG: hypothetical protein R2729_02030 [Bryobacteraceae bacterium]
MTTAATARILDFQPATAKPANEPDIEAIYVCPDLDRVLLTAMALRQWHIRIHHAESLADIDLAIESSPARVLITAGKLPDGDWQAVLRQADERGAQLSTVVVLGEFDGEEWIEALQRGAYDVLVEPVAAADLARSVGRAWRWSAGRQRGPVAIPLSGSALRRARLRRWWDRIRRRPLEKGR